VLGDGGGVVRGVPARGIIVRGSRASINGLIGLWTVRLKTLKLACLVTAGFQ